MGGEYTPATRINATSDQPRALPDGHELMLVECAPRVTVADHHNDGDPGHGLVPSEYWRASLIGQLVRILGKEMPVAVTRRMRIVAAMDHCFGAALRGECPGVSRKEVIAEKERAIAEGTGALKEEVHLLTSLHERLLDGAPEVQFGGCEVRDLRQKDLGVGYSKELLTAQLAAALLEVPALFRHRDTKDGPTKNTLYNASPEAVQHFMKEYAPAQGMERIYGVPTRGYAGGYESEKSGG